MRADYTLLRERARCLCGENLARFDEISLRGETSKTSGGTQAKRAPTRCSRTRIVYGTAYALSGRNGNVAAASSQPATTPSSAPSVGGRVRGHTPPTKRLLTNRNGRARRRFYAFRRRRRRRVLYSAAARKESSRGFFRHRRPVSCVPSPPLSPPVDRSPLPSTFAFTK